MAAQPNGGREDMCDDVIVAAGAAGSVLANRLTEDASVTVRALGSGPPDRRRADGPATDPTAVVDDELRVPGTLGLRVVDGSIMPDMPSANTYVSTMMIAEKASDMIRGRQPLATSKG